MLLASIPQKFPIPFASGAGPGFITQPIPQPAQPNGRASLVTGFSELNFDPLASGGIPPWGADFNGLLYQITQWLQWAAAGGFPVAYDATFQTAIGGYPKYALIQKASGDRYWLSTVDNNNTNPETGGAGWSLFPDVIVQAQAGNWVNDAGAINAFSVTLSPLPASLASIKGAPIRFFAAHANSVVAPTINIVNVAGDLPVTIINSNGNPLLIGQIARAGQICEGFYDGTFFQLTSPGPIPSLPAGSPAVVTGVIYEWPAETPPTWGLECNGATPLIASFPNLFNVIGTRFGGDGVNTFGVPDKRGAFTRGWDHGRGLDPNATTRTRFFNSGGIVGDHVGSWELSAVSPNSLAGTRMILTGDPTIPPGNPKGNPGAGPIFDPTNGFNAYPIAARDQTLIGGPDWDELTSFGRFATSFIQTGDTSVPASFLTSPWEVAVVIGSISGANTETRPVNIDMMYVIAF